MSALGLVHGMYKGGVVHVALSDPSTSNQRQRSIWAIAKAFGTDVASEARRRRVPINSLPVWTAPLLVGLVGRENWYCVFCDWPGVPTVHTQDLRGDDPPSVDAILAGADIDFADARYAFATSLQVLDSDDPVAAAPIDSLVKEFFDFHLGVKRREGDDPKEHQLLLAAMATIQTESDEEEPGWRVRIRANPDTTELLPNAFRSQLFSTRLEVNHLHLRSSDFARYVQSTDVLNHANQLLHLAEGVLHLWTGSAGQIRAESAEHVHSDGSVDGQLASAQLSVSVWSQGGKEALAHCGPGATQDSLADSLLALATEDAAVQRVLKLVAQTDRSWADLYTILDTISKEIGGNPQLVHQGWATNSELERFERTANTAELGRHAQKFTPPKSPMPLSVARETIFRITRAWLMHVLSKRS